MAMKPNTLNFDINYGGLWITGTVDTLADEVVELVLNNVDLEFDIYDFAESVIDKIEEDVMEQYREYVMDMAEERASTAYEDMKYDKGEF